MDNITLYLECSIIYTIHFPFTIKLSLRECDFLSNEQQVCIHIIYIIHVGLIPKVLKVITLVMHSIIFRILPSIIASYFITHTILSWLIQSVGGYERLLYLSMMMMSSFFSEAFIVQDRKLIKRCFWMIIIYIPTFFFDLTLLFVLLFYIYRLTFRERGKK